MSGVPIEMAPGKQQRIRLFANFFKSYMSVSTILAASVPIPVASLRLIPVYTQQRGFLTVYASLFSFLLLAFVFSMRHRLAPHMFAKGWQSTALAALPAGLILAAAGCVFAYHACLLQSIEDLRGRGVTAATATILDATDMTEIPRSLLLAASYLGIFLFAEAAFVMMAIREYLQDLLRLDEHELLHGLPDALPEQPD